jgi:uncharacterized membrane protein YciS (DUF1049 family)
MQIILALLFIISAMSLTSGAGNDQQTAYQKRTGY